MLKSPDGITNPISFARDHSGEIFFSLRLSSEGSRLIDELKSLSNADAETVLTKALLLYQEALRATHEGKFVGVAKSKDDLETEFVGLLS
jgi:hypothetical protein